MVCSRVEKLEKENSDLNAELVETTRLHSEEMAKKSNHIQITFTK